jgi:phage baseplate assembly protein W
MAIILGRKPLIETKPFEDYALGLKIPIQIGNVAFAQNFTQIDQLKANIKNLLLTKRGERIMNPDFGCGIETVLFEQITDDFEEKIQDIINEAIEKYLPSVLIEEINLDMSNDNRDKNTVNISIKFRSATTGLSDVVSFDVQQIAS